MIVSLGVAVRTSHTVGLEALTSRGSERRENG